jgi:hypothetical protein
MAKSTHDASRRRANELATRANAWRLFAAAAAKKQDYFSIESRQRLFD